MPPTFDLSQITSPVPTQHRPIDIPVFLDLMVVLCKISRFMEMDDSCIPTTRECLHTCGYLTTVHEAVAYQACIKAEK
jgi:hypothetical protein